MAYKTVVLKIEEKLFDRLSVYSEGVNDGIKLLIVTAVRDYVNKREARTRRAKDQRGE